MKIYTHFDEELLSIDRVYPWQLLPTDSSQSYYDFKSNPDKIGTSLAEFLPFNQWDGVDKFYQLLEWLNGNSSILESSNCGNSGFKATTNSNFHKQIEFSAQLMILYRNSSYNLSGQNMKFLESKAQYYLQSFDVDFEWGVVGTTIVPTKYVNLPVPDEKQLGSQLILHLWAWGDSKSEVMENFGRVSIHVKDALIAVCRDINAARSQ